MEFFEALWENIKGIAGKTVTLGDQPVTTLNIIVWSLFIGFVIGIGATLYNKIILGAFVRSLLDRGASSEALALSAEELGCSNPFIRFALRKGSTFRRIVRMAGDTETELSDASFENAKFYIPEESSHRAETIYGNSGTSVLSVLLSILAFLVVAFVCFIVIPDLTQMLVNFVSEIKPESNTI